MSANTKIEWCDHTFNPWTGCTKVSPGCANCYAEGWAKRSGIVGWGPGAPRLRTSEANWKLPVKWNRDHTLVGQWYDGKPRPRVFCASLADWLDDEVPVEWLADLLALIHATPNLDWLLLTKRPENWKKRIDAAADTCRGIEDKWSLMCLCNWWIDGTQPPNIWIGTTVENQDMADIRIPQLLSIPAKVRFLSCEPLLEPIDISYPEAFYPDGPRRCCNGHECGCMGMPIDPPLVWELNWVICCGESGPGARPMNPTWARSLRDQCASAGVPFFMKQMGGTRKPFPPIPDDLNIRQFPQ